MRVLLALPKGGPTLFLVEHLLPAFLPSCSLAMGLHGTIFIRRKSFLIFHVYYEIPNEAEHCFPVCCIKGIRRWLKRNSILPWSFVT
jgi:hypothetical protein